MLASSVARSEAPPTPDGVDAWFEQANERFAAHDYTGALGLLERACAQSDFAGCALNLGAVHHALRHCAEARRFYGAYLQREPSGERAGEARAALDELTQRCREPARPDDVVSVPPPAEPASAAPRRAPAAVASAPPAPAQPEPAQRAPLDALAVSTSSTRPSALDQAPRYGAVAASLMVLGGAAGLTSIYLGSRLSDVNRAIEKHKSAPYDDAQARRLERMSEYRSLTIGSGVASAVLLGVGGVFLWLGADSDTATDTATDVGLAFDGRAELRVRGRF